MDGEANRCAKCGETMMKVTPYFDHNFSSDNYYHSCPLCSAKWRLPLFIVVVVVVVASFILATCFPRLDDLVMVGFVGIVAMLWQSGKAIHCFRALLKRRRRNAARDLPSGFRPKGFPEDE